MDFDYTTETITPDSTSILTIGGTGALELPSGTTAQEPAGAVAGAIRWNNSNTYLEYYSGSAWLNFGGSVTSVNLTAGSGISVSGGPITTSGSITVNNTGVLSVSGGTTGLTPATATTGAVTLGGTLVLANGGTGASLTGVAGGVVYSTASAMAISGAGTAGYLLVSGGTGAPTWTNAPTISGANITAATIPNSALANSSITVTGGTGLGVSGSPVALGGTVTLSNTGVTSNVAGTGIAVSGATGAVTISTSNIPNSSLQNSSVTVGTTTIALGGTATALTGITGITLVSGTVTGVATPVNGSDVVPLSYLQNVIAGIEWKAEAVAATTTDLGSVTYANGTAGVGATITANANGALTIDGYSPAVGSRVLIKNETTGAYNGIYTVTNAGSGTAAFVLTRAIDANTSADLNNATLYITNGTVNANTAWTQTVANPTLGTTTITFVQTAGSGTYSAGTGLTLTGSTFSITNVGTAGTYGSSTSVPVFTTNAQGQVTAVTPTAIAFPVTSVTGTGAGISVSPTTGAVVVSNTGVTSAVAGTGISVSGATGAVTFANTGVLSFSGGTTGLTPATATTGAVTLAGTLGTGNGGTGSASAPTAGQLLVGQTGGTYTPFTVTTGTGISTTTGSGTFQINNTGVTSNVAGTGITVSSATGASTISITNVGTAGTYGSVTTNAQGQVTSGSVIAGVANGGTGNGTLTLNGVLFGNGTSAIGQTAAGTTGQVLVGNTGAAPSWSTLTGIAVTSIAGTANQVSVSASTGAVTISTPSTFTAPGSITSTTTMTAGTTLTISGNTANTFLYSGTAGLVSTTTAPTNGQLLIGSTGAAPTLGTITGSNNVTVTLGAGTIALSGPKFYSEFTTAPVNAPSATASQSIALGTGAVASKYGEVAISAGQFTAGGDAQTGIYTLRNITTNATPAIAYLDGSSARLTLPTNSAFLFDANIVARRTDATGTFGAWNIKGLVTQDATAATTTVQGTSRTFIAGSGLNINSVSATADTTNGALQFNITGVAAETIRWVITCKTTEVGNA